MELLLNQINEIAQIILAVIVTVGVVGAGIFIYYAKFKKKTAAKEGSVNYSTFNRKDSQDYLRFDDIEDDMVITENGTRFIGAVNCTGFDFYSALGATQLATKNAYMSFIGTLEEPITYRQSCKKIDLEDNQNRYLETGERIKAELEEYRHMHHSLLLEHEKCVKRGDAESISVAEQIGVQLEELEHKIDVYQWRLRHLADQMDLMEGLSSSNAILERDESYIFDWVYNPINISVEYTDGEIRDKARKALESRASALAHALSSAGVKAKRVKTAGLVDMFRRHFHPVTADIYRQRAVDDSAYYDDIVTTPKQDEIYMNALSELATGMAYDIATGGEGKSGSVDDVEALAGQASAEPDDGFDELDEVEEVSVDV